MKKRRAAGSKITSVSSACANTQQAALRDQLDAFALPTPDDDNPGAVVRRT